MEKGAGTISQVRAFHGTQTDAAMSLLRFPFFTVRGGAGSEELRRKYGQEIPVAYFTPTFECAIGYADGCRPMKLPNGPETVAVVEVLLEGDPEYGDTGRVLPRLYHKIKGRGRHEQWLTHSCHPICVAVWLKITEPFVWTAETNFPRIDNAFNSPSWHEDGNHTQRTRFWRGEELLEYRTNQREPINPSAATTEADPEAAERRKQRRADRRKKLRWVRRNINQDSDGGWRKSGAEPYGDVSAALGSAADNDDEGSEPESNAPVYDGAGINLLEEHVALWCFRCQTEYIAPEAE